MELQGQIRKLIPEKGYGFIKTTDGKDYFFHVEDLVNQEDWKHIRNTQNAASEVHVQFIPSQSKKGPRASNVVLI